MTTLADSLVSSTSRKLALRVRPDLEARRHVYQGKSYWVVKEPIGLKYFRFQDEEYAILQLLDGTLSIDEVKERFEQEYAPQKLEKQELQQFLGVLHRNGLLLVDAPDQGRRLYERRTKNFRRKLWGAFANILSFRWRGVDPDKLLERLLPYTGWYFTRPALAACACLWLAAGLLVLVQFSTFQARLPGFHEFFGPANWIYLGCTLGAVKVLHEFGHGLSCKKFGGECHEMGFMLLVFTPALYCNVSDSWLLPSKWQRAAIGAAGMYVELTLASLATFGWWFSEPGLLNHLCLSIMFVCSVSTVFFNGNPLLRFDGYYILSDLLEVPNLRQKAASALKRLFVQHCLGVQQQEDPFLPKRQRGLFAAYTVAAFVYRWMITFSIILFLNSVLEPIGLKVIGQAMALAAVAGMVVQPVLEAYRFLRIPGRMHEVKRKRVLITAAVVAAILAAIALVPLPHDVTASVELQPRDAASVYAQTPGRLTKLLVAPGQRVAAGQALAELENPDEQLALLELEGRRAESAARLAALREQRLLDHRSGRTLPELEKALAALDEELAEKRRNYEQLTLRAPVAGVVIPPPSVDGARTGPGRLEVWSGSPLEVRNVGARLEESELFCRIGEPQQLEAVLFVDEADIDYLRTGQAVRVVLESHSGVTIRSRLAEVSREELDTTPARQTSQGGGDIAVRTDAFGSSRPLHATYQARAPLEDDAGVYSLGVRGRAKVSVGWQPLGLRLWRWGARTFHFTL